MKKFLIGLLLASVFVVPPVLQAETLTFSLSADPKTTVFKRTQKVLDNVALTAGKGLKIKLIALPLDRAILYLKDNKISGDYARIPGLYRDASNVMMVPYPIARLSIHAFSKIDIPITGWDSFANYRVLHQRGQKAMEQELAGRAKNIHLVNSIASGIKMLAKDRADVYIGIDIATVPYCLALKCKESGIKMLTPPLKIIPLFLYLNKAHERWAKPLAEAFKKLDESGRSADIMDGK